MAKTIYLSKLVLKNFQTYKTATFNFTSKLNFIAAPNGSGKSSITNAINFLCLGTAKTINKNCELDQYIRFGEQLAFVEGYFVKNGNTTVIKREIRSKQSKYYINGKQATKKDVSEFMKNNCIDVNNMTQFLPQEKVSEFAKLSSEELMNEVLQTFDNFEINLLRHEVMGNEKQLDELIMKINHLNEMQLGNKKIVDSLKEEVMKYEEMNLKRRRIDLLELKVQYINYNDLLSNIKNESMKIETNEELIKQSENAINEIAKQIEALENSKENSAFKSYVKDFEAKNLSLSDFMELIEKEIQACEILNVDIANLEKKKETRKKELESLNEKTKIYNEKLAKIKKINMTEVEKTLFDRLTLEIDKFRANNEYMDQILKIDSTVENNKNQALNFESHLSKIIDNLHEHKINIVKEEKQIHEKSLKTNIEYEKLQKLKIEFGQTEQLKLNNLKNYNKHCYEGVCWLRKNQQLFKQEILEPAFLHVNIKNMDYIKEIENCISYNMLVTFVCQNDNDFATFTKLVKDEQKLNVNVMVLTDFNDNTDSTKIRQLGFDGTVLDFIETRKEYVNLFCLLGNVHRIPISKRKMDDANLFEKYDYKKMIINERYLEVKRSRYDKRDCVMTDSGLRTKNIFGSNESAKKEIEDIERRITEIKVNREDFAKKVKTIFTQKQSIEDALNKFYNYKSEYREKHQEMTEYNVLKTKLTKYIKENDEKIIEYSCNKAIDNEITEIQQKVNEKNLEIKKMVLQSDVKMKNADFYTFYKELSLLLQAIESNLEKQMILADQKRTYEIEMKASKETISATKMHINELKKERDTSKEKIKNKIEMLQNNETGTTSATKIYTELERLNPSKQKLEDEIITLKADIDFIKIDKLAIEDYKTRQYKLKNIDKEKDQAQSNFDAYNAENNIKRECLIEKVNHFVDLIDSRFRYFFEKINSEGRIVFEHTNLKCDKWKLNIMVKFRKHEELAKLTSFRQSGGEKSVSTVLFLLAMQNLSKSPFKLVDEINQGMDRYNEKMINDLLIDLCEEEDSPQFFLITSKIVQGINFSDKVKIFVIYNNVNEEASSGFGNYLGSIN